MINRKLHPGFRNAFTIAASYFFYGCWDWRFLGLIIISSGVDFWVGQAMGKTEKASAQKALLLGSLLVNLGFLGFFKYYNFFVDSLRELLALFDLPIQTHTLEIILPVGISFYTFQTMSYTIDIYRRQLEPTRDPLAFFAFVSFFPQLVAGPIERASQLLKQFEGRKVFQYQEAVGGLRLILWGLFKKTVIADNFGQMTDLLLVAGEASSGPATLLGSLFFALQIYADFSAYSDIAIGCSRLLGMRLMQNFQTPYFSTSLRMFWHRWHISLSTWFRDYVYIPLGGNRGQQWQVHRNLFLTFVLSGLWHGAQFTFLIWGALHGLILIVERQFKLEGPGRWRMPLVFLLVVLFWMPFRAEDMGHLNELLSAIFQLDSYTSAWYHSLFSVYPIRRFVALSIVFFLFTLVEWQLQKADFNEWVQTQQKPIRYACYYALLMGILFLGNFSVKPQFIYFQF
ncbi:MAG: MBOAT family O-acyltransferase [Bacteroidota bacterium]